MSRYVSFIPMDEKSIRVMDIPIVMCSFVQVGYGGRLLVYIQNDESDNRVYNLLRNFARVCGSVESLVLDNTGYRVGDEQNIEIIETDGLLLLDISSRNIWDISNRYH